MDVMSDTDRYDQMHRELRSKLFDAFAEAKGPHGFIPRADAQELGVHRDLVGTVTHRSHHVRSEEEAIEAADELAQLSVERRRETDAITPDQVLEQTPRFM